MHCEHVRAHALMQHIPYAILSLMGYMYVCSANTLKLVRTIFVSKPKTLGIIYWSGTKIDNSPQLRNSGYFRFICIIQIFVRGERWAWKDEWYKLSKNVRIFISVLRI